MATKPKVYAAGEEGSPLKSVTGKPVRIEEIRAHYNRNKLWQDPDFPPVLASIGDVGGDSARKAGKAPPTASFKWLRPHAICRSPVINLPKPEFAVVQDSFSKSRCSEYDIQQSWCLGDCWYVCALQALTKKQDELAFVIPEDNYTGFDDDKYCGAFHFRIYIMTEAKWVDVVVDDLLPCDVQGRPAFAQPKTRLDPNHAEFWCALIEKAYAKLHGSYYGIEGGYSSQALENFSGGFSEIIDLKKPDTHNLGTQLGGAMSDLFMTMKKSLLNYIKGDAFMALDTYSEHNAYYPMVKDGYGPNGKNLYGPHAYTILDIQEVKCKPPLTGSRVLLKVRNPWGHGEWKGAFADTDDWNWGQMERDLRTRDSAGCTNIDEGVFWIDLGDVIHYFNSLEICHYGLTHGTQLATAKGSWPAALQKLPEPYLANDFLRYTAYKFEVKQGTIAATSSKATGGKVVVCYTLVLQGSHSGLKPPPRFKVRLYKMELPTEDLHMTLGRAHLRETDAIGREASSWTFVDPGTYVLVPALLTQPYAGQKSAFPPEFAGKEMGYAVRVFTQGIEKLEAVSESPKYENQRPVPPSDLSKILNRLRNLGLGGISDLGGLDVSGLQHLLHHK